MEESTQVEQDILKAAETVFYRRGKDGASMQEIADEAGITRTSLNYYYRTKDKLFEAVFKLTLSHFVPRVSDLLKAGKNLLELIPELVEIFVDAFLDRPHTPIFMLQELASHPERVPQVLGEMGVFPAEAVRTLSEDPIMDDLPIEPAQMFMNILSLTIFPFAAKPLILPIMFNNDEEAYEQAMKDRKVMIPMIITNVIKSFKP